MPTLEQARTIEDLWSDGEAISMIAKTARLSHAATRRYIHEHVEDCPPRRQSQFSKTERQFISTAWNRGATTDQIAGALSVKKSSVVRYIGDNRDTCPYKVEVNRRLAEEKKAAEAAKRAETSNTRLSESDVEEIVSAYKSGLGCRQIAEGWRVGHAEV